MRAVLQGQIESLTLEGHGVTRVEGKVYFVDGALPGETVEFEVKRSRRKHGHAKLTQIIEANSDNGRVEPDCEYFGVCGGCSFRHYEPIRQLEAKQQALLDALERIGRVTPNQIIEPATADWLHYRRKARLGIRFVEKKGGALVGFREKGSSFITPLNQCFTLTKPLSDLLPGLAKLVNSLTIRQKLPQIEVAQGDNQISLVFRHLQALSQKDLDLIESFAKVNQIQAFLQPKGLDSIHPLYPKVPEELYYKLDDFDLRFYFAPTDFIQVNSKANQLLINMALDFLNLQADDRVLDLYCGLGNFSLPLAQKCKHVLGVEGDKRLVDKAIANADKNHLDNVTFQQQDLSDQQADFSWLSDQYNKVLLDPARSGAALVCQQFVNYKPEKIVYVSCNPTTLARDANVLTNLASYQLTHAGIINMFPHTAHIESIAVFER